MNLIIFRLSVFGKKLQKSIVKQYLMRFGMKSHNFSMRRNLIKGKNIDIQMIKYEYKIYNTLFTQ